MKARGAALRLRLAALRLWLWRRTKPLETPPDDSALCARAASASANPMFITDRIGRIVWINAAFSRLTGYTAAEAVGRTPQLLRSGYQSAAFYDDLWRTILAGRVWRGRLVNRRRNGEVYDVEQTISPVPDARGQISHFFVLHEDICERLQAERRRRDEALFDPATHLPNWNIVRRRIVEGIASARRRGRSLAVITIANGGTGALCLMAETLRAVVRQSDVLGRHRDVFVVVAEDLDEVDDAAMLAQRALSALGRTPASHPLATAGIAGYPGYDDSPEALLQHAERARATACRPGDLRFFRPGL